MVYSLGLKRNSQKNEIVLQRNVHKWIDVELDTHYETWFCGVDAMLCH